jgi:Putative heavy-metal-binding
MMLMLACRAWQRPLNTASILDSSQRQRCKNRRKVHLTYSFSEGYDKPRIAGSLSALGANAVVDLDYEVLGENNGMMMVSVNGTAVIAE